MFASFYLYFAEEAGHEYPAYEKAERDNNRADRQLAHSGQPVPAGATTCPSCSEEHHETSQESDDGPALK